MTELRDAVWRAIQSWAVADGELDIELRASEVDTALDALAQDRRADDWQPIETAPEDRLVMVWASPRDDLPGFVTIAQWNEWAGWCVDELRDTTHWRPLPKGPGG